VATNGSWNIFQVLRNQWFLEPFSAPEVLSAPDLMTTQVVKPPASLLERRFSVSQPFSSKAALTPPAPSHKRSMHHGAVLKPLSVIVWFPLCSIANTSTL
jgi:hypothetical protein